VGLGNKDYSIPASNPLIDSGVNTGDEIWAGGQVGSLTGDLFSAVVRQESWEEID
jgi:hypothetical protein